MCSCNQKHELIPELENLLLGEEEYEAPPAVPPAAFTALTGKDLDKAVQANQRASAAIHWGCIDGGRIKAGPPVLHLLGLPSAFGSTPPTEKDWANAVKRYQNNKGLPEDGVMNDATWKQVLKDVPPRKFQPLVIPVEFNGKKLGYIEKTIPYLERTTPATATAFGRGGTLLQMGFRVTDWDAVRKAGFSDAGGHPPFRWIQVVEFVSVPSPTGFIRQNSQTIDPTSLVGMKLDKHPYYFDEQPVAGNDPNFVLGNFVNAAAFNNICYDLVFIDVPSFITPAATPGHRAWFNFETALIGIKQGTPTRNTILATIRWGFDIVIEGGVPVVHLNHLAAGMKGGSTMFKKVISKQIGSYPDHCFTGSGFSAAAACK